MIIDIISQYWLDFLIGGYALKATHSAWKYRVKERNEKQLLEFLLGHWITYENFTEREIIILEKCVVKQLVKKTLRQTNKKKKWGYMLTDIGELAVTTEEFGK